MTKENRIGWNFNEEYYHYLIKKVARIDYFFNTQNYQLAFGELKQIFIQIQRAIRVHTENGTSTVDKLNNYINEIDDLTLKYNSLVLKPATRPNLLKQSKLLSKINKTTYNIYSILMEKIDEAGMLFAREEYETMSGEKKFDKKYIGD